MKNRKPDPIAELQRKAVELKCGKDQECWNKEAIEEEKRFREVSEPLCERGGADHCYQVELLNAIKGASIQE